MVFALLKGISLFSLFFLLSCRLWSTSAFTTRISTFAEQCSVPAQCSTTSSSGRGPTRAVFGKRRSSENVSLGTTRKPEIGRANRLLMTSTSSSPEVGKDNGDGTAADAEPKSIDSMTWDEIVSSNPEIQQVRLELIQKYLDIGRSKEEAIAEVDDFLSDRDRSEKFLDMRRYAMAQKGSLGSDLGSIALWVSIGLVGNIAMKYIFTVMKS